MKVPISGICFLRRGEENKIRRLSSSEAIAAIFTQTHTRFKTTEGLENMINVVDSLVRDIPIYELTNRPEPEAAFMSYKAMTSADCEVANEN